MDAAARRRSSGNISMPALLIPPSVENQLSTLIPVFKKMASAVGKGRDVRHKLAGTVRGCFSGQEAAAATGLPAAAAAQACSDMLELNLMRHYLNEKAFENSPTTMYVITPVGQRMLAPVAQQKGHFNVEMGELTSRDKNDALVDVVRQMIQDIELRDRILGLKKLPQTFLGFEAVDWVCGNTGKARRLDAVALLSEMLRCGLIKAVDNAHELEFSDSTALYQELVGQPSMSDFNIVTKLPIGCFTEVTHASFKKTNRPVAFFTVADRGRREGCATAANAFRRIVHPNIVRVLHSFAHERTHVVISDRGSASFLEALQASHSWTEVIIANALRQACTGLSVIHSAGLIYGAFCPQAMVLAEGGTLESLPPIKLVFTDVIRPQVIPAGSRWASPSLSGPFTAHDDPISQASDLFSLGAVLHLLLCGFLPSKVTIDGLEMSQSAWDQVSDDAQILVKTLLRHDPKQRPNAAMTRMLPWFSVKNNNKQLDSAFSTLRSILNATLSASSSSRSGTPRSGAFGVSTTYTSDRRASLLKRGESFQIDRKSSLSERVSPLVNNVEGDVEISEPLPASALAPPQAPTEANAGVSSGTSSSSRGASGSGPLGSLSSRFSGMSSGGATPIGTDGPVEEKLGGGDESVPLRVVVLSRDHQTTVKMFLDIADLKTSETGVFRMRRQRGGPEVSFVLVDLHEAMSMRETLCWHPSFVGADLVMLIGSLRAALDDNHSASAVSACRSIFKSKFFGPAPAPTPIVMALSELVEFREVLLRDKLLGLDDPESPEYQQRENRLLLSITDRFEHINKKGGRPFRVLLLPALNNASKDGLTSPPRRLSDRQNNASANDVSARVQDGRRSFAVRKTNPAVSLQEISDRYSTLAPTALTESGADALARAIYECVVRTSAQASFVSKDMLARLDREHTSFRTAKVPPSLFEANMSTIPPWLRMISLSHGSAEQSLQLVSALPAQLECLQLDEYPATGSVCQVLCSRLKEANSKLQILVLQRAGLTRSSIARLADGFIQSRVIQVLDVSHNTLGDDGMEVLADALVSCASIVRIHARNCGVRLKGFMAWRSVFRLSHSLEVLDLAENPTLGDAHQEIQALLSAYRENVLPALRDVFLLPPLKEETLSSIRDLSKRRSRLFSDVDRYAYLRSVSSSEPSSNLDISFCLLRHIPFDTVAVSFIHVTKVNLSHNSFPLLPSVLWSMALLEELVAVGSNIESLPPGIGALKRLRRLSLASNKLSDVPSELCERLTNLEHLDLRYNCLRVLPSSIGDMVALQHLYLQHNRIVSLPASIFSLENIDALRCEGNPMHLVLVEVYRGFAARSTTLNLTHRGIYGLPPEVAMLSRVTELLLAHNNLTHLPPQIADMKGLVALDISHNQFERIPSAVGGTKLMVFKYDHNPMTHVSPNVLASPLPVVLEAAKAQNTSTKNVSLARVRIFVVGDQGMGKTTVANRLVQYGASAEKHASASLSPPSDSVITAQRWTLEDLQFSVWDFAGASCQEMFPIFATDYSVFILCISLDTETTTITNARVWLENVRLTFPQSSVIIVGTHADVVDQMTSTVMERKVRDLVQQFGQVKGFLLTGHSTARSQTSDLQAKILVAARAITRKRASVSEAFLGLEASLLVQREIRNPPLMTRRELESIASLHGISEAEALNEHLSMLHSLGTLYDPKRDTEYVILDPMWLSNVLGLLQTSLFRMTGVKEEWLPASRFQQMWKASENVSGEGVRSREILLSILCDLHIVCRSGSLYNVPMLLSDERPSWLWNHLGGNGHHFVMLSQKDGDGEGEDTSDASNHSDEMRRVFSVPLVRFGLNSRLMTYLTEHFRPLRMWRNLLLADLVGDSETTVSLECYTSRTGGGSYDVRVRGPNGGRAMDLIAGTLLDLFEQVKLVERLSTLCVPCGETHQIARPEVSAALAELRPYYVCPNGYCIRLEVVDPTCDVTPYSHRALKVVDYEFLPEETAKNVKEGTFFQRLALPSDANLREAWVRASLVHKNIVPAAGIIMDSEPRYLMYRMMPLGTLDRLLQDQSLQVEWKLILRLSRDICEGLRFAHNASPPVVHGSLRACFVMLSSLDAAAPLVAKVSGFSVWTTGEQKEREDDVYGFGSLLVELLTRDPLEAKPPAWCPPSMVALIRSCQTDDRAARPSFRDIRTELMEIEATTSKLTVAQMKAFATAAQPRPAPPAPLLPKVIRESAATAAAVDPEPAAAPQKDPNKSKKKRRVKKVRLKRGSKMGSSVRRPRSKSTIGERETSPEKGKVRDGVESMPSTARDGISETEDQTTQDGEDDGQQTVNIGKEEAGEAGSEDAMDEKAKEEDEDGEQKDGAKQEKEDEIDEQRSAPQESQVPSGAKGPPVKPPKPVSFTLRFQENRMDVGASDDDDSDSGEPSSSLSQSSSQSQSESEGEDEGGPCLACRMEKNPIGCMAFVSGGGGQCVRCRHPLDAHAVRMKF